MIRRRHAAVLTDPNLVNAWGISRSGTSPFWVSANGTGVSTLYRVNPVTGVPSINPLVVSIPGVGNVTGQVFANVAGSFNGDAFLFVSEDGTVSGWRGALGTLRKRCHRLAGQVYKGSAFENILGNGYLYGANFRTGKIDVYKGNAGAPDLAETFVDPGLPAGYAPFNIQDIGGKLYVTYALKNATGDEDAAGLGQRFRQRVRYAGQFSFPRGFAGHAEFALGPGARACRHSAPMRAISWWATSATGPSTCSTSPPIPSWRSCLHRTAIRWRSTAFGV